MASTHQGRHYLGALTQGGDHPVRPSALQLGEEHSAQDLVQG